MTDERPLRMAMSKHTLIMLLCCLAPLAVLGILWAIGVSGSYLIFGVLLLCLPLHVFIMRGIHKSDRDGRDHAP